MRKKKGTTSRSKPFVQEPVRTSTSRNGGGCGCHETPEAFAGPKVIKLEGSHRGHQRTFQAVHMDHSPSGGAGGSFRIDEQIETKTGPSWVTRGYYMSYPDFAACVRVTKQNTH